MVATAAPAYRRFRQRLVKARRRAGLTQAAVAAAIGKPQSYVSKCETGERRVDVIELAAFARLYAMPLAYFLPFTLRRGIPDTLPAPKGRGRRRTQRR